MLPSYKPRLISKIILVSLSIFYMLTLMNLSRFNDNWVINSSQLNSAVTHIFSSNQSQKTSSEINTVRFKIISPSIGWVIENNRLFWTNDNGNHWTDITPSFDKTDEKIETVFFKNEKLGWMISSQQELTLNRFTIFT